MTVSSTTLKNSASGNGSTTAFAYNFKVFAASELKVYIVAADGTETLRTEGSGSTNYAVTGIGDEGGGTVTFVTAPASGETVVALRDTALTQSTDYLENDSFPANSHEAALDKITHIVQELDEENERSLRAPVTETAGMTLPTKASRLGKTLAFDGTSGDAIAGPTIANVTNAETLSTASAASATAAASSASAASSSAASAAAAATTALAAKITISTSNPTGGSDGDVWFKVSS